MLNLKNECAGAKTIAISGHVRPDGDCVGSTTAMYRYLKKVFPDAQVDLYLEKPADIFRCLADVKDVKDETDPSLTYETVYDLFIALDCSTTDRLGNAARLFDLAKKRVVIDHHISNNGLGDVWEIRPDASSTCEILYDLMEPEYLDEELAKSLYVGIIHDTGVFQYSNTGMHTLEVASKLVSYGFNFATLIDETFYEKTYLQNQIMGRALLESILFMDGRCIVSSVDRKTMEFYGANPKDLDGIVNQLRLTKGVEVAIFMYETATQEYKVSMRSSDAVDVASIATFFGGGGHKKAAGCTMNGSFHDVVNNLSGHIAKQLGME